MRLFYLSLVATALAIPAPAIARQPTQIDVNITKPFKHVPTGIKLPPVLGGLQRQSVTEYAPDQLDVGLQYENRDRSDIITVYLYRNVSGGVPVWFDRAQQVIALLPDRYRALHPTGVRPFTPRGQKVASGLMESMSVGGDFKSTGLMVLPVNGFYAKIRISSKTRDVAGLEQLMMSVANEIDWQSKMEEFAAEPVTVCDTPLAIRADAKLVPDKDRMADAVLGSLLSRVVNSPDAKVTRVATSWCRQAGTPAISYGVYRTKGTTDAYILALIDSGRAVTVGPNALSALLEKDKPVTYGVNHVDLAVTTTFQSFQQLPTIERVIEQVANGAPVSRAKTWGKGEGSDITVFTK